MLVTVYNFDALLKHIECHKDTVDIVLCGEGDDFDITYEVVYRKENGFLKDLTCKTPKICGNHFIVYGGLWGIIIHSNNSVEVISVGQEKDIPKEARVRLTGEYLKYHFPDYNP